MPSLPYLRQPAALPALGIAALAASTLVARALPGGGWNDTLALLASLAALFAAVEHRSRDMLVAIALAAGLAPCGLLLAPLVLGLAIGRQAARHLPLGLAIGLSTFAVLPWSGVAGTLPNLAIVAADITDGRALIVAIGAGIAAWLGARASILQPAALLAEARLGVVLLATVLPLPIGALAFVLILAALPRPSPTRHRAANDNTVSRRTIRLAA